MATQISKEIDTNGAKQVRRALKTFLVDSPEYERLLPFVKGNVGFVFTNGDLKEIRDKILANKVAAPARAGAVAPVDVWIPAGNTGMEPGKTSFFQALGVPTKIARGTIEITTDLKLVEAGAKVGPSEATLLNMLNISPFTYGMGIAQVYDQGNTFPSSVLDISEEQLLKAFSSAITTIAAVSLALNFPTLPSVIHSLVNSYKKVLAVAIETEISWPEIEELKDRIANPEAYAAAAPVAAADSGAAAGGAAAEEEKEEEEESDEEGGFGDLLYVFSVCVCVELLLTILPAVKCCNDVMMALVDWQFWFGSGKGFMNRYPNLDRSFAGQLSTLKMDIQRIFELQCSDCPNSLLAASQILVSTPLFFFFFFSQHSPHVSMIMKNDKELFNPDLIDEKPIQQRMRHNHLSFCLHNLFSLGIKTNMSTRSNRLFIPRFCRLLPLVTCVSYKCNIYPSYKCFAPFAPVM